MNLGVEKPDYQILQGDCIEMMRTLPDGCVRTCVTSPPYFGLRDYGAEGQIGLENTPEAFCQSLVEVFREVRRVLADDGTLWVNLGDTYAANRGGTTPPAQTVAGGVNGKGGPKERRGQKDGYNPTRDCTRYGLKHKDLIGIPWRVAFALQADGWYLRQDIIWSKPNPMPESVKDRCTKAHEYIFLLSKSPKYFFDSDAIRNPPSPELLKQVIEGYKGSDTKDYAVANAQSASSTKARIIEGARKKLRGHTREHEGFRDKWDGLTKAEQQMLGSNRRSVWNVATKPFKGAHFATFPPELIEPCVLSGSSEGDLVLDPFAGSGTTGVVALKHGRRFVGCELNPEYVEVAHHRIATDKFRFS